MSAAHPMRAVYEIRFLHLVAPRLNARQLRVIRVRATGTVPVVPEQHQTGRDQIRRAWPRSDRPAG